MFRFRNPFFIGKVAVFIMGLNHLERKRKFLEEKLFSFQKGEEFWGSSIEDVASMWLIGFASGCLVFASTSGINLPSSTIKRIRSLHFRIVHPYAA